MKTTGNAGDDCFWYAFGLPNNTPLPAKFLLDLERPEAGAILFVFDEVGGDVRRSVKHMSVEVTDTDRRRNGGWSYDRLDKRPEKKAPAGK
jgi:hypothetical protein